MRTLTILLFLLFTWSLPAQLILKVVTVPAGTPAGAELYAAGSFNDWNPADPDYRLARDAAGNYHTQLFVAAGPVAFKITRGSWERVEGDERGQFRHNRKIDYRGGQQVEQLHIQSWEDLDGREAPASTAAANVQVLDPAFPVPQLDRQRRIWLYLPPGYDTSQARYPVLYLHDGQNVFDASTSFAGEWQADETLNRLASEEGLHLIAVAVDNGGKHRLNEYSPWTNDRYGGGEGADYLRFIVNNLKPYIDSRYRTRPEREYTGILGSSMGGLISLYGAIEYQEVFGLAGILSPALWFSEESLAHVARRGRRHPLRFYLMAGREEGQNVVDDLHALGATLQGAGFEAEQQFVVTHPDGDHSEWYWAREFDDVVRWLYTGWPESEAPDRWPSPSLTIGKDPDAPVLEITYAGNAKELQLQLTAPDGQAVLPRIPLADKRLHLQGLGPGSYLSFLYRKNQLLSVQRLEWKE